MAANEVNDIVIRLLGAAEKIGGREREEILHHVGRLSRAATRERTAAVDEMQKLRKKIVQQSTELKRLQAPPVAQDPQAHQPPLAGGYGRFNEDRMQALRSGPTPALDYGSDYGRLSRPDGISQPTRKAAAPDSYPVAPHGGQGSAPAGMPAVLATTQSLAAVTQEVVGYGHFNPARFLALQAAPAEAMEDVDGDGRHSLSDGPAVPAYNATAANAEPVGPRGGHREGSIEGSELATQAADQLLDEISNRSMVHAGQKRKASGADQLLHDVGKRSAAREPRGVKKQRKKASMTASQVVSFGAPAAGASPATTGFTHTTYNTPSCVNCVNNNAQDCDGNSYCNNCHGVSCRYVLCDPAFHRDATCAKIHRSQYDRKKRVHGEPRRNVLGDNIDAASLKPKERRELATAIALMDTTPLPTMTPFSAYGIWQARDARAKDEDSDQEEPGSSFHSGFAAGMARHPFHGPEAVNDTVVVRRDPSAPSGTSFAHGSSMAGDHRTKVPEAVRNAFSTGGQPNAFEESRTRGSSLLGFHGTKLPETFHNAMLSSGQPNAFEESRTRGSSLLGFHGTKLPDVVHNAGQPNAFEELRTRGSSLLGFHGTNIHHAAHNAVLMSGQPNAFEESRTRGGSLPGFHGTRLPETVRNAGFYSAFAPMAPMGHHPFQVPEAVHGTSIMKSDLSAVSGAPRGNSLLSRQHIKTEERDD